MAFQGSKHSVSLMLWIFIALQPRVGAFRVMPARKILGPVVVPRRMEKQGTQQRIQEINTARGNYDTIVVVFQVHADLTYGNIVHIVGNHECLGSGDPKKGSAMNTPDINMWTSEKMLFETDAQKSVKIEYQYFIDRSMLGLPEMWEEKKREITLKAKGKNVILYVQDRFNSNSPVQITQKVIRNGTAEKMVRLEGTYKPWPGSANRIGDSGAFGYVYRLNTEWGFFAMKKTLLPLDGKESVEYKVQRAAAANGNVFVTTLVQTFQPNAVGWQYEYALLELMSGGSLYRQWPNGADGRKTDLPQIIFAQLVMAVQKIHVNKVVHRDLKLENILVNKKACVDGTVKSAADWIARGCMLKVADFGISCIKDGAPEEGGCNKLKGGTFDYLSPDVFLGNSTDYGDDVWACGIILYELVFGRTPCDAMFFHDYPDDYQKRYAKLIVRNDLSKLHALHVGETVEMPPAGVQPILQQTLARKRKRVTVEALWKEPYLAQMKGAVEKVESDEAKNVLQNSKGYAAVKAEEPVL